MVCSKDPIIRFGRQCKQSSEANDYIINFDNALLGFVQFFVTRWHFAEVSRSNYDLDADRKLSLIVGPQDRHLLDVIFLRKYLASDVETTLEFKVN